MGCVWWLQRVLALVICIECCVCRGDAFNVKPAPKQRQNFRLGAAANINAQPPAAAAGAQSKKQDMIEGLKNGCASGLAAGCVKTLLQPFDTIKTVQQYSTVTLSFFEAGKLLLARSGVPALYSGLGVTIIGSMPSVGIYFGIYGYCRRKFDSSPRLSRNASVALSAGIGNLIASFFRVPYEIVKQRLQAGVYPNTLYALNAIWAESGVAGFFGRGGIITQLARDIPYAIVTLLVYESLQSYAAAQREQRAAAGQKGGTAAGVPLVAPSTTLQNMVIGAIAGGIGTLATNPMDVVKTRMMTSPHLYAGALDVAMKLLQKEGPVAFLRGATPRLLHKIPANALFFAAYELFRALLGVKR